jgi:3-deoxy-D-manno-octulosonic-acid transferase
MYLLYSILLTAFVLLGLPYFVYRAVSSGKYWPSLRERLGFLPPSLNPERRFSLWVHAVSVGEVLAARPLIPLLREAFPDRPLFVSVTTLTGRRLAERQIREADGIFYCPFDWALVVRRVVRRIRPKLLLVVETEIWPHLLRACRNAGSATLLVNGRISDRSYPRYRLIRPFLRRFLRNVDRFCMQSADHAERIIDLGADPSRVTITGSLKFDAAVPDLESSSPAAKVIPEGRPVIVAGCTLAPEEEILLEVFATLRKSHGDLFLILAPRHPERFEEVTELARSRRLRVGRRSLLERPMPEMEVLVLDTIGELAALYGSADVVFVGGSLAPWGGHNVIEPAAFGKPIVFGPHMSNFRAIAAMFLDAEAAIQVNGRDQLQEVLEQLIVDTARRTLLGEKARRLVEENRGAARRTVRMARQTMAGAP